MLSARWSRRRFEAAGLSPDEARSRFAGVWRTAAVLMIGIGGCGFAYVLLSSDPSRTAGRSCSTRSSARGRWGPRMPFYLLAGVLLFWRNRGVGRGRETGD